MRKEVRYKGYVIKPIYKKKWAVYKEGLTSSNVPRSRNGTVFPDERVSINFDNIIECKRFIDKLK